MSNLFFTADWHFGHRNIIRLSARPFKNIDEHDNAIIRNINNVVSNEDTLYILGDLGCYKDINKLREMVSKINGKKYVILGNHDSMYNLIQIKREGLIEEVKESKTIQYGRHRIFLSHYPHREWPGYYRQALHFYGHVHNNLKDFELSTDVGVDAWNYKPVRVEELIRYLKVVN